MSDTLIQTSNPEAAEHVARETIERFISNPELLELASAFGFEPQEGDLLPQLKEFSNQHWDFRKGKERHDTDFDVLDDDKKAKAMEAAASLGMVGFTEPKKDDYNFVNVPGGAKQSPILRVSYAKNQMEAHGIQPKAMFLLGSSRQLGEAERADVQNYAPGAKDEFDLMNAAAEQVFGVQLQSEDTIQLDNTKNGRQASEPDAWRVRYYQAPSGLHIISVSAPQIEGERRVNTADTFHFVREVVGAEELNGANILNVTTDLYVPFQDADAKRLLGLTSNAKIETIGYGGIDRPPESYLQEINSAFNQMILLQDALTRQEAMVA